MIFKFQPKSGKDIMDRRDFIKISTISTATALIAPTALAERVKAGVIISGAVESDGKAGNVSNGVEDHLKVTGYVREPKYKVTIVGSFDVIVVGGGPSGVAAAVSAARNGSSVLLIEKANFLGGLWTGGLVLPVLATRAIGKSGRTERATLGFCEEVCKELLNNGWATNPNNPKVDPEAAKYILDKKILDAGVTVLYNTDVIGLTMSGNKIESVIANCNTGRIAVKCKMVVDASGDGCIFNWAGDPHEARRYHISTSYRTGGCDSSKVGWDTPIKGMRYRTFGNNKAEDGLDIFRVSQLQQQHRIGVWDRIQELKQDPECSDVFLMECAPITGIRVTRVLDSLHNTTLEESMEWTEYEDVIGLGGICDPFDYKGKRITHKNRPIWQIPYRSLLPKETQNLLVAGRCFGYDQGLTWDAREISTCFVTGQAAGLGASLAVESRCAAKEVNIKSLQNKLAASGVRLNY